MTTRDGTGPDRSIPRRVKMNTLSTETNLKAFVCAAAAVALTVVSSWSFVASTATVPGVSQVATESLGDIVIEASRLVAQNGAAVLLD
jgi:hypothetical protein